MSSKVRALDEPVLEGFAARLVAEMEAAGLSAPRLAALITERGVEISATSVRNWRKGTDLKASGLLPLADVLGVRVEWLLTGEEPRTKLRPEDDIQFATNEPPAMYPSRPLDRAVLRRILMAIDREQVERHRHFSPERRAEAIAVVYEMLTERTVDDEAFQHFIRALLAT